MTTAPNYPIQEVLISEGEGIDLLDLNDMQRFLRSQLWDSAIGGRIRASEGAYGLGLSNDDTIYCYGGGAPQASVTTRTITNSNGLLFHLIGTFTGADPVLIPYVVESAELDTQLAVGDATNPRIDLIAIK